MVNEKERAEALCWSEPKSNYVKEDEVKPSIFNELAENEKYLKEEQDIIKAEKITTEQVQESVVNITQADSRVNLATTEKVKTTFGKIKKWFSDLRALAFKDKVADSDIIGVSASKVSGLHSVATSGNYTVLNNKPTISKEAIGLGNVENVRQYSANNKPTKTDVGLSSVDNVRQYSANNQPPYPVTKVQGRGGSVTINKTDVGLGNVANERQYSSSNRPPYPVTSVNGMTGAVIVDSLTIASISNILYPVGSIKITTVNTNPKLYLGGDWVAWGSGRVPVGVSSDSKFNTVEKTGGSSIHKLAINEMPSHSHDKVSKGFNGQSSGKYKSVLPRSCSVGSGTASGVYHSGNVQFSDNFLPFAGMQQFSKSEYNESTGGYSSHNNLQPYITCYMWKRTS